MDDLTLPTCILPDHDFDASVAYDGEGMPLAPVPAVPPSDATPPPARPPSPSPVNDGTADPADVATDPQAVDAIVVETAPDVAHVAASYTAQRLRTLLSEHALARGGTKMDMVGRLIAAGVNLEHDIVLDA